MTEILGVIAKIKSTLRGGRERPNDINFRHRMIHCRCTRQPISEGIVNHVTIENDIIEIISTIRKHQGFPDETIELESALYDDGIGLDSLCVAELSAMLEKAYGKDPYTSKVMPQTVRDIVNFYNAA